MRRRGAASGAPRTSSVWNERPRGRDGSGAWPSAIDCDAFELPWPILYRSKRKKTSGDLSAAALAMCLRIGHEAVLDFHILNGVHGPKMPLHGTLALPSELRSVPGTADKKRGRTDAVIMLRGIVVSTTHAQYFLNMVPRDPLRKRIPPDIVFCLYHEIP